MRRPPSAYLFGATLFLAACGSSIDPAPEAQGPRGTNEAQAPAVPAAIRYVSFVPETEVGQGPARVSFENTTVRRITFWLGQIRFFAVPPGETQGPDVATSADVKTDTTVGVHQEVDGTCAKFRLTKYQGPAALVPGASYSMRVAPDPDANGFEGVLTEVEPQGSFVAVRAELHDASKARADSLHATLNIELADAPQAMEFESEDVSRSFYVYTRTEKRTATRVTFVERSGARFVSSEPIALDSAPGYTAIVDEKPLASAAKVASLARDN